MVFKCEKGLRLYIFIFTVFLDIVKCSQTRCQWDRTVTFSLIWLKTRIRPKAHQYPGQLPTCLGGQQPLERQQLCQNQIRPVKVQHGPLLPSHPLSKRLGTLPLFISTKSVIWETVKSTYAPQLLTVTSTATSQRKKQNKDAKSQPVTSKEG